MTTHKIVGGKELKIGMRVFTNDWRWGTVLNTVNNRGMLAKVPHVPESPHADTCKAWFDVELDDGTIRSYDCTRMSTTKPV